ncbi:MAG: BamA/TamA family outer membrane protein [Oligosphaeraceae bacterium]|nr:BamA/TamA family outer membrane protein [Oligosphaeraceae bacterium]
MKTIERNTKSTLLQRKSTWSLLSFFLLALFLAAPMQAQVSKKDLRASQKEVARLESDYAKLSKQMQKIEKTIQKLDAQINNEQAKLNRIAQEGAELEPKRAAAVKKEVDKLQKNIATLQGKRTTELASLAEIDKERIAKNTEVNAAKAKFEQLKGEAKLAAEAAKKEAPTTADPEADDTAAQETAAGSKAEIRAARAAKVAQAKEEAAQAKAEAKAAKEAPVTAPWVPVQMPDKTPVLKGNQKLTTPEPQDGDLAERPEKIQFDLPMISGDKEIVEKLKVWQDWAEYVTFNPVTIDEINAFQGKLVKALQEQGYVFANVQIPTKVWGYGIFLAKVDCGTLGSITVRNAKHYSPQQIIRALENQEGKFNYAKIHGDLFDLNIKPDLKVDTKLRPITEAGRRSVDAELTVEDKLPIHGAIEFTNSGHKQSNDYRLRTTLQHLNLTKHDDSLTLDWLTGGDIGETLNAFSINYFLPLGDKWAINTYGGYNQSRYDAVLPEIDVVGKGHYFGLQLSRLIYESEYERVQLTFGWLYQKTKNHLGIDGDAFNKRAVALSMPSITLGYAAKTDDRFGGRNFANLTLQSNFAGKYGASEKIDFIENDGAYSEGDFLLAKLQLARIQRLFAGPEAPGKWSLFGKVEAQLADDSLPGAARDYLGGFNSVRGYEESEIGGDNSVIGTLELRTPLLTNFIPGLKKDDEFLQNNPKYWGQHRLQFVAFTDYAYVNNERPYPGEYKNQDMWSVGLGLRLGLTNYSQMSLDYGYPIIEASSDTPSAGRFHISLQLQF